MNHGPPKRLAAGALLDMPGAPLPAIAAAQAALGGLEDKSDKTR